MRNQLLDLGLLVGACGLAESVGSEGFVQQLLGDTRDRGKAFNPAVGVLGPVV